MVPETTKAPSAVVESSLFSDESRFNLSRSDGRTRVYRRKGERYADCCVVERDRFGGGSVMVWAGICGCHRTDLITIEGNLTAQRYCDEILEPTVRPFMEGHLDHRFQQDNARPHSARITRQYFDDHDIDVLPWPANSPDLSPIEHLWDEMERRLRILDPQPETLDQLRASLIRVYNDIPQAFIRNLINSMRRRIRAVLDANGGHTRY